MRIAIILVIIGVIVGIVFYGHVENQRKLKMEALAFEKQVEYATMQNSQIEAALDGLESFSDEVWKIHAAASNLVPEIVGQDNAVLVYDKDYEKKKKAAAWKETVAKVKASGGAPETKVKVGVVKDEMGREAPAGLGLDDGAKAPEPPAPKKPAEAKQAPEGASAGSSDASSVLKDRIAKAQVHIEKVTEHCYLVDGIIAQAATIREESAKILEGVRKSTSAFNASKLQPKYLELLPMAKDMKGSIAAEIEQAKSVLPLLEAMKQEVLDEIRRKEEAEEAKRKAEELEARRKRELADAAAWYDGKADLLKNYQFEEAKKQVEELKNSLTFEEAKTQLDIPALRYELMHGAMNFLKAAFNKAPLAWGWPTASGKLDIQRADEQGIYVQEKVIPWLEIPKEKMVGFFMHYLKIDEQVGKAKADIYAGVALYCKTFGAPDSVDDLIDKAINESALTARQIPALMEFTPDPALSRE